MRLAMLASLTGHALAVAALATLDWRTAEFAPSIPVAVLVPPALGDQAVAPAASAASDAPPPPARPATANSAPSLELSAALSDPIGLPPPQLAPSPARKPLRQVARPAPGPSPAAASAAPSSEPDTVEAPAASATGLASAAPATAPIVEHGPAPLAGNPRPDYPPAARRRAIEGRAVIRAVVAADGRVASVELRQSSAHELLDRAALEAVRRWRFMPAQRGEQAVDGAVDVPVVFRLED